jgi:predicted amidohydrolase
MTTAEQPTLTVALISDVFYTDDAADRLHARLREAKAGGAELAILPELPLNPWSPATKQARDDDAELPNGPRTMLQRDVAREIGIGLVGGAIVRDPDTGIRRNTALIISATGELLATYCKNHLPEEPGFWETSHYDPGAGPPIPIHGFAMPIGVQICSDINRPEGSHLLGAMGAEVILAPRATELATYERWKPVFIANALTSCTYMLSVNRPKPEQDVLIGGPSIAVAPNGKVMLETTEPVGIVTLSHAAIAEARVAYPGYLPVRAEMYARAWRDVASCPGRSSRQSVPPCEATLR